MEVCIVFCWVGIFGILLSVIDVVVVVVVCYGVFYIEDDKMIYFFFYSGSEVLEIILMLCYGVLLEVDFYCLILWELLEIVIFVVFEVVIVEGSDVLLDWIFELIVKELEYVVFDWSEVIGFCQLMFDSIVDVWFVDCFIYDFFQWVQCNLQEVECNKCEYYMVFWCYVILCLYEVIEIVVLQFNDVDSCCFCQGFVWVFIDNYVVILLEFICWLLVLYWVGILWILMLGEDYELQWEFDWMLIVYYCQCCEFDVFIDVCG